jgi:hypothetical protein
VTDNDRARNRAVRPRVGQKKRPPRKHKVINQRAKTARMDDDMFWCWGCKKVCHGGDKGNKQLVDQGRGKVPYCRDCCEARGYEISPPPVKG